MPNQILANQPSSRFGDTIKNQIEHKNFNAGDADWLAYSWVYYNKVIYGKFKFPTL